MFIITLCTLVAIYCVLGFRFLPKRPKNASIQWRAAPASPGSPGPYRQAGERSEEVPVPQKQLRAEFEHVLLVALWIFIGWVVVDDWRHGR